MATSKSVLLWFRQDLRIRDNAAFAAAMDSGNEIIPVFIWDEEGEGEWLPGAASRVFLHQALQSLASDLKGHGLELVMRTGSSRDVLQSLLEETDADGVFWNRRYEPTIVERDSGLKKSLRGQGKVAESFNATLLHEPWEVSTQAGKPFQVFTPFWRNAGSRDKPDPIAVDLRKLKVPSRFPKSDPLDSLDLLPSKEWGDRVARFWEVGETAAEKLLNQFLAGPVEDYDEERNRPDHEGTSKLSPYLHWGLLGPRQVWRAAIDQGQRQTNGGKTFLSEIGWREFAYHVLYHFPHTPEQPLRDKYKAFPWKENATFQELWRRGKTGYPIVDAGMRQLWEEGWMHNRVRMIVGSLLVKHLLQPWTVGARWFWDCLVDGDLASNTLGWQWAGGCGADAAPYFRVFNPMTQGKKFDPDGKYVRRYVPELAELSSKHIHEPWEASEEILEKAGICLGEDYPYPIIEHKKGRERALKAFEEVKG